MANYLSPLCNEVQTDSSGNPLVGGKVYTYVAGTTTAATTYTEDGVAQANPIILNASGLPANAIWLQGGTSYKFVIKDSTDATLRTVDDITGINDPANASTADQWVLYGAAPTYIGATSFSVVGDQTATFQVARRIKSTNTGGTRYSTITASSYNAGTGLTTVTVQNDSGTLDSGLSQVSYGLLSATDASVPRYRLGSFQTFTSSNTWTRPTGCRAVLVEVQAGGGGGGGASGSGSGSASGGGGGAGGYSRKWVTAPGATETVTVGAAGTVGADTGGNGGAGGNSSFGSHATATGGTGGGGAATRITTDARGTAGGAGGGAASGDLNITGGAGGTGAVFNTTAVSGAGGDAVLGRGSAAVVESNAGATGGSYGGGGSGGCSDSATGRVGGAGAPGIVIVWEFY